jgi:hypothetical protein
VWIPILPSSELPKSWLELVNWDRPLDFEAFLQSDLLAERRHQINTISIPQRISGSISCIASTSLVWHILRSHHGLSTTYHRLVFGLSIADIMSSLGNVLSSTMVPKEMNYFIPQTQGNAATCNVQGFLMTVGYWVGSLYNCSICFYYLAIIRYNKKDEYIKNKLSWNAGFMVYLSYTPSWLVL